uniref:Flavin-containing monooxygenase n=1 Tax=Branchiostoma floridae TaxID=7739 RepID=C3ZMT0_BRAFL|eukprot:XP_002590176.1 hypothetical protein BRAFLDRAFT_90911 [Branchiostoma floridae]
MESTRRVAIIGAGVSGLACIKACLEEGLEPVCFEQHDQLGGVWYYTDEPRPNQGATIYKSLVSNRTKEMMSFSDFPQPKEAPPFLPYTQVHSYLREFADKFELMKFIQFGVQVQHIWRADDYDTSGKWLVRTAPVAADNNRNTCPQTSLFDSVMVCSGHFSKPFVPKVPGLEEFTGVVLHSRDYSGAESFKGRKVMVVGDVGDLELYKMMFPARLPHSSLAVIGCVGTIGPIFPVLEIQSRWAALVLSGRCKLPDPQSMQEWLRSNREKCKSKIGRVSLMVCTLPYCEDIAQEMGVRPSFWQLLLRDPYLAYLVYFGPAFPTHYRLVGPHRWAGAARHAKLAVDNTYSATKKSAQKPEHCFSTKVTIVKVMFTSLCVIALGIVIGISY